MVLFDNKEKQKKRLVEGSAAIRALLELNSSTRYQADYSHFVSVMRAFPSKQQYDEFEEKDALALALASSEETIARKKANQEQWDIYVKNVNDILMKHPFTEAEAKACQLKDKDYFALASPAFWETALHADNEDVQCVVQVGLLGVPNAQKTFEFSEKDLLEFQEKGPEKEKPSLDSQPPTQDNASSLAPQDQEVNVSEGDKSTIAQTAEEQNVNAQDGSAESSEDDPFGEDEVQENQEENGESTSNEESVVSIEEGELSSEENRTVASDPATTDIRDAIRGDETLEKLYPAFQGDKTIIALIARELIFAKRK